jgi:hypothetical protein
MPSPVANDVLYSVCDRANPSDRTDATTPALAGSTEAPEAQGIHNGSFFRGCASYPMEEPLADYLDKLELYGFH